MNVNNKLNQLNESQNDKKRIKNHIEYGQKTSFGVTIYILAIVISLIMMFTGTLNFKMAF